MATETTIRSRIKTIAATVLGFTAGRCVLGDDDLSTSAEFFRNIVIDGLYALILPAEQTGLDDDRHPQIEVKTCVFFGYQADADYTFSDIETQVYALRDALNLSTNWTDVNSPLNIVIPRPEIDRNLKPVVGKYEISLSFTIC